MPAVPLECIRLTFSFQRNDTDCAVPALVNLLLHKRLHKNTTERTHVLAKYGLDNFEPLNLLRWHGRSPLRESLRVG